MILHSFKQFNTVRLDIQSIELFLSSAVIEFGNIAFFPSSEYDKKLVKQKLLKLNPKLEILEFPDFDCSFFANLSPTSVNKSKRISTLYKLMEPKKKNTILLSSLESLIKKTIKIEDLKDLKLHLKKNNKLKYDNIINFLQRYCYEKVDFVYNPGEYAIRGEILDIFSPLHEFPIRILFDFEHIEKLNLFSTDDQLTKTQVDDYMLFLPSEFQFNEENIRCFREFFRKLNIRDKDDFYKSISNGQILPGSEQFFPILYKDFSSILNYLSDFKLVFDSSFKDDYKYLFNKEIDSLGELKSFFQKDLNFFLKSDDFIKLSDNSKILFSSNGFKDSNKNQFFFSEGLSLNKNKKQNLAKLFNFIKERKKLIFCISSKANDRKIKNIFNKMSISFSSVPLELNDILKKNLFLNIFNFDIKSSFILKSDKSEEIIFFSDQDIFDKTIKKNIGKNIKEENLIEEYSSLKYGDFIVHTDHGIGKYNGLKQKKINNVSQDFIEILYFGDDKLLIPVENLEVISKYGQGEVQVSLDKLGLQNWQQRKALVKKRIRDIASVLLKTAAERKLKKADILKPKIFEYEKFSSEFDFTETSDQIKSILQIENDLSSGQPMDRLICGDVGFGKTEIAMRAAFISVSSGYQVAIICPKLLLVNQHHETFKKRFNNFSYKIEKITRLETPKKKRN